MNESYLKSLTVRCFDKMIVKDRGDRLICELSGLEQSLELYKHVIWLGSTTTKTFEHPNKIFLLHFKRLVDVSFNEEYGICNYDYNGYIKIGDDYFDCEIDGLCRDVNTCCDYIMKIKLS